jgi:beta-xylosidase
MIKTNIKQLRDPFVLVEDDAYYMYGSKWLLYKNVSGRLDGEWVKVEKEIVVKPSDFVGDVMWAPEVHKVNGYYYMFTTYTSKTTGCRGCATFKADNPEGPFVEVSNGHFTPKNKNSIDATLYFDKEGQPWCVFVDEHVTAPDKMGRMDIAKFSSDLTRFVSEPIEIFRADDPVWTNENVTDGCFLYNLSDGGLLMIWSNYQSLYEYALGVVKSDNGKIDGKWIHQDTPLYSKAVQGKGVFDGGHGMIFTDRDGQEYICFHSPNYYVKEFDRRETPVICKIKEENGTIVLECD